MKTKLVLDLTPVGNFYAGIGQVSVALVRSIARLNLELIVMVREKQYEELMGHTDGIQCEIESVRIFRPFLLFHLFFMRWYVKDVGDIYFCVNHRLPLFLDNKLKIGLCHDFVYKHFPESMRLGGRLFDKVMGDYLIRKADLICFNSLRTFQDWEKFVGPPKRKSQRQLLYNLGVTNRYIANNYRQYNKLRPTILYVGSLEPRKNVPTIIEAFGRFQTAVPGGRIVIVSGDRWGRVSHDFTNIEFHWRCSDKTLADIYKSADILVMNSSYEGFSLPLLEAAYAGLVIISTQTGIAHDLVIPENIIHNPRDVSSIFHLLIGVHSSHSLREKAISFAKAGVTDYSFDKSSTILFQQLMTLKPSNDISPTLSPAEKKVKLEK